MAECWGIYDTKDNLWIGAGEENKVRLFTGGDVLPNGRISTDGDAYLLARLAAELVDIRMGWEPGRCRAREFKEDGPMRVRDEQAYVRTMDVALKGKESGRFV
jgi:hypothetical protein